MKMDQIAFACSDELQAVKVKLALDLADKSWIKDVVTALSEVLLPNGERLRAQNVAELQFNYDLGIELEILRYVSGPNWHQSSPLNLNRIFTSHSGIHLEDGEEFPDMNGFPLVQETWTLSHTAPYLTKLGSPGYGRKYHYRIHELSPGSYVKFIRRVLPQ